MITKVNGTSVVLYVDGFPVSAALDCTVTIEGEDFNVTNKGSQGWREVQTGLRKWSVDFSYMADPTDTYNINELIALIESRQAVTIRVAINYEATISFEGLGHISNITIDGEAEQPSGFSGTFTPLSGAPVYASNVVIYWTALGYNVEGVSCLANDFKTANADPITSIGPEVDNYYQYFISQGMIINSVESLEDYVAELVV